MSFLQEPSLLGAWLKDRPWAIAHILLSALIGGLFGAAAFFQGWLG